jgi:hypothetical protein
MSRKKKERQELNSELKCDKLRKSENNLRIVYKTKHVETVGNGNSIGGSSTNRQTHKYLGQAHNVF